MSVFYVGADRMINTDHLTTSVAREFAQIVDDATAAHVARISAWLAFKLGSEYEGMVVARLAADEADWYGDWFVRTVQGMAFFFGERHMAELFTEFKHKMAAYRHAEPECDGR